MQRTLYLIAYDIREPKRLRHIGYTIKVFATGGQKSAYECYLTKGELQQLLKQSKAILNSDEDYLLIIKPLTPHLTKALGKAEVPHLKTFLYFG